MKNKAYKSILLAYSLQIFLIYFLLKGGNLFLSLALEVLIFYLFFKNYKELILGENFSKKKTFLILAFLYGVALLLAVTWMKYYDHIPDLGTGRSFLLETIVFLPPIIIPGTYGSRGFEK